MRRAHALSKHPLLLLLPVPDPAAAAAGGVGASGLGGSVGRMVDVGVQVRPYRTPI